MFWSGERVLPPLKRWPAPINICFMWSSVWVYGTYSLLSNSNGTNLKDYIRVFLFDAVRDPIHQMMSGLAQDCVLLLFTTTRYRCLIINIAYQSDRVFRHGSSVHSWSTACLYTKYSFHSNTSFFFKNENQLKMINFCWMPQL